MKRSEIVERVEDGAIHFVAILEVLGKPKEHIVQTATDIEKEIAEDDRFVTIKSDISEPVEVEDSDSLFSLFCEVELLAERYDQLFDFCFKYMPASVEVIEPEQFTLRTTDANGILNDFVSRVHEADGVVKQKIQENKILQQNLNIMVLNAIRLFLRLGPANPQTVSKGVGIDEKNAKDFLEKMVTDGILEKSSDLYQLKKQ